MKEAVWNKTGMKQLINSGWKEFDEQTNCISTGNVYANTQMSSFIRPYGQLECNGRVNEPGHLTRFDLQQYEPYEMPNDIMKVLMDKERKDSVILYMFYITKNKRTEPFCWVLTDRYHRLLMHRVVRRYGERFEKRCMAAHEVIKYITEE